MKKFSLLAAICLVVALTGAALASGGENILISVSHLNGAYATALSGRLQQLADERAQDYLDQRLSAVGGVESPWTKAETFVPVYPRLNEYVLLSAGSGLVWRGGEGSATAVLLDVTAGEELGAGESLTVGHRYLAELDTMVVADGPNAACSVEGTYQTNATGEPPRELGFADVSPADWYYDEVFYVVEQGLFNGTGPSTFSPDATMNRGMLATVLHRLAGGPAGSYRGVFEDVADGEWYTPGVEWAAAMGVVNGVTPTTFAPGQSITREQIAVMLYRYAAAFGYDTTGRADVSGFADGSRVSAYAQDAMAWAVEVGILQGSGDHLNPGSNARRCEVATMLMRFDRWLG